MNDLGIQLQTREKINRKIYRMGFEARPLLYVGGSILIVSTTFCGLLGFVGYILTGLLILGFVFCSRILKREIEKGNTRPLDNYFENMLKPDSIVDDGVIDMLRAKKTMSDDKSKSIITD